jgi:hypothetical protein
LSEFGKEYIELTLEYTRDIDRYISRSPYLHWTHTEYTEIGIMDESSCEECVEFAELVFTEKKKILTIDDIFDGSLVVEDHLCFSFLLSLSCFIVLDEYFCIEIGVGISFHLTGCIREIDEEILYGSPILHIVESCHRLDTRYHLIECFSILPEKA